MFDISDSCMPVLAGQGVWFVRLRIIKSHRAKGAVFKTTYQHGGHGCPFLKCSS